MTTLSFPYDENIIFPFCGAIGAIIMFVADLILYYPTTNNNKYRTASSYFETIDPGGSKLSQSSMQFVSINRVMLGGVLGPISAIFYTIGFFGIFFHLLLLQHENKEHYNLLIAAISSIGFSLMMSIGSVYHALFPYTCFLSKEIAKTTTQKKKNDNTNNNSDASLYSVLQLHQSYLRYIYKWAGTAGLIGSMAYIYSCLITQSTYPRYSILFVPAASAPIKKLLKKYNVGGIILCGGLTNLWNLCFFTSLYYFNR